MLQANEFQVFCIYQVRILIQDEYNFYPAPTHPSCGVRASPLSNAAASPMARKKGVTRMALI